MPDLLLELFSEEIPARMQKRAAEDLKRLVTEALVERGFLYEGAKAFATPRRLALHVAGLPARGRDVREERKGPRVGAPEAALQGFLKSAGLASIADAKVQSDPKKGEFYLAVIERPGRPTPEALAEIVPQVVRGFPWPKSMRWGAASAEPGSMRWVRPLHSILCTFGPETEEPEVVRFEVDGIASGDLTRGHRFMAPEPFRVRRFDDYAPGLERARVVLDAERRRDIILHDARDLAFAQGLELVEDEGLLEEVAGLVEWPVVLMGSFDEAFLDIPPEVIRATIRANQKCFVLKHPSPPEGEGQPAEGRQGEGAVDATVPSPSPQSGERGRLANRFILVSNLLARDGGEAIVAGNERVVRARLSDAKFFWETDKKVPLESRLEKLKSIVFHEKLGTQYERVERIAALARELAPAVGADPDLAERAARLAKADLVTEMVGEFPELQGLMGRYYATLQGEHPSVAAAIEEHYKPLGPSDRVPTDPVSVAVALADKIDTLVGFWAIDEKPTGSKDPYALRRAALGVVRLVLENELGLKLMAIFEEHLSRVEHSIVKQAQARGSSSSATARALREWGEEKVSIRNIDLLSFFADRLKVHLREQGARHDLIDAVFALGVSPSPRARGGEGLGVGGGAEGTRMAPPGTHPPLEGEGGTAGPGRGDSPAGRASGSMAPDALRAITPPRPAADPPPPGEGGAGDAFAPSPAAKPSPRGGGVGVQDDLLLIVRRVEALGRFLDTEDGRNLLAGYRRAANILRIEEKRDGVSYDGGPDLALIEAAGQIEEKALVVTLAQARREAEEAVAAEDFEGAMRALSRLRAPLDAFFERVTVNADDPALRANRLKLLNAIRAATRTVADFSKIEG